MSHLVIRGGSRLRGEAGIQGAKNSVLPILAATLLTADQVELRGCPRLRDVDASVRILEGLGCTARWEGKDVLIVDARGLSGWAVSEALMREMRSSAIFLGAILARCGQAELSYPGGCELGPRPIDLHLSGLRDLGAEIDDAGGVLHCKAPRLRGREIVLSLPSVGATENLMLAACGASGVTTIANAAREPEIVDLQNFLTACGARVSGAGTSTVSVEGGRPLHGCTYAVMPDRIAAATYLCAAASTGSFARSAGGAFVHRHRRAAGGGLLHPLRRGGHRLCQPGAPGGGAPGADGPLSRLSHRRPGHFDGGAAALPGGGGIRGKYV